MISQNPSKLIVVFGGTGRTGSRVALSLCANPDFNVRIPTRAASSEKALKLRAHNIDVVQSDFTRAEQLRSILHGAWGVFLNTDSEAIEHRPGCVPSEADVGRSIVKAARGEGVRVMIFAGLPDAARLTGGKVQIDSFNSKETIRDCCFSAGFESAVSVNVGWRMENFWDPDYEKPFGGFARVIDEEGFRTLRLFRFGPKPEPTPFTSLRYDYGDIVHGVFLNPEKWNQQVVWAVSDPKTFQEVVDIYNRVSGRKDARFVVQTERAPAPNPEKEREVNGIRDYVDHVRGLYCNGETVDLKPAQELKEAGAAARGVSGPDTRLISFERYMKEYALKGHAAFAI